MKRLLFLLLLAYSTVTLGECYVRSDIKLSGNTDGPKDVQKLVVPMGNGLRCTVRYRVLIDGDWHTAEGSANSKDENRACLLAQDPARASVLAELEPRHITANTNLICSDLPDIRVRPVRIGEVIWESEVDVHTIPKERRYFWYKRSQCRMFVERDVVRANLWLYQGIICRVDTSASSKWRVIDKY